MKINEEEFEVTYYVDDFNNDCYRIEHTSGLKVTVSSAHLIDEKKIHLQKQAHGHN